MFPHQVVPIEAAIARRRTTTRFSQIFDAGDATMFPQSTHSWLFTQDMLSLPFWFSVGIAGMSYVCLILAFLDMFWENYDPGNPFSVPFQVSTSVRMAQYFAMFISLIMEEEIPTGLYLLRMISKESLSKKFPKMQFARFVFSAFVRLGMGYLFLFNTFCVVVQATTVLDIFYDVLALQFIQRLDDIAFNLAKIDVFGQHLKHAALSKHFRAEFEKQPFALRKRKNVFLKAIYFLNLAALLIGMSLITVKQNAGGFHARSITVTFGDQIWTDAILTTSSGDMETRTLLFSYFNGVYVRDETADLNDGRPVYVEQNKFDGSPFGTATIGAEIKYCKSEEAWVFAHKDIKKSEDDNNECPWLLRSPITKEFNLLDVTGNWAIWTGSLQNNGHFSVVDNQCQGEVDCNYHGDCVDGECVCFPAYFGIHCEHEKACALLSGGEGGIWAQVLWADDEMKIYQRPVYEYEQGVSDDKLREYGITPHEDSVFMVYTGSRWLGVMFRGTKRRVLPRIWWQTYVINFHAFWQDTYNKQTKFASDPTTQSSVIGIDFYVVGMLGEEFGPFGQLFPLSDPKGSGLMRCVENELAIYTSEVIYRSQKADFSVDGVGTIVVDWEVKKGRECISYALAKDCVSPITGIDLKMTPASLPRWEGFDLLSLEYTFSTDWLAGSNIWNANTSKLEFCQVIDFVIPAVDSNLTEIVPALATLLTQLVPV